MVSSIGLPGLVVLASAMPGDPVSGAILYSFGAMNFAVMFAMGAG